MNYVLIISSENFAISDLGSTTV